MLQYWLMPISQQVQSAHVDQKKYELMVSM